MLLVKLNQPEVAEAAKQQYTKQAVQADELLSGTTQAAPTAVGQHTITGSAITAPTTGVSATSYNTRSFDCSSNDSC